MPGLSTLEKIQASYLVPPGSLLNSVAEVDRPGHRIATKARAAYGLWLENNIRAATLVPCDSMEGAYDAFVAQGLEALAGLRPALLADATRLPGARVLQGQFSAVRQAVGTPRRNVAAAAWLAGVVEELKSSGVVARLIEKHGVTGLSVAPPA
jgi:polar amino acid transport system substrate-binding protein